MKDFYFEQNRAKNEIKIQSLAFFSMLVGVIGFGKLTLLLFGI